MIKIYTYSGCYTCKNAIRWLSERGIEFQELPIRETPPSADELKTMLDYVGDLKKLFNTSGKDYREMKIALLLPVMSQADALDLLNQRGNLVKRPFLLGPDFGFVGFKEEVWSERL